MSNVKTGELLSFQDYSPEHDQSARIDVEAVHHSNQYNVNPNYNAGFNDTGSYNNPPSYDYTEPPATEEVAPAKQSNHNFWTVEYYQKYFDVDTNEVVERIISSVVPTKVASNYFDDRIQVKPDLYGPVWISVTLIFTIAVSGNISNYLQNANKAVHWRYDFHLVSYAATAITCYVWLVPLALWGALKWSIVNDQHDQIETQSSSTPTMMSLFCLYGYSLSIYIPVAILWTIQVSWLQWLLVLMAAFVSGAVLIYWMMPTLKKSKYSMILIGSILAVHFLLATGFMLYFFHVPSTGYVPPARVLPTAAPSVQD